MGLRALVVIFVGRGAGVRLYAAREGRVAAPLLGQHYELLTTNYQLPTAYLQKPSGSKRQEFLAMNFPARSFC
jgi:hypothetical protein